MHTLVEMDGVFTGNDILKSRASLAASLNSHSFRPDQSPLVYPN